jgi:cytosine deaminase
MDLVIKNAKIRGDDKLKNILIKDGKIVGIEGAGEFSGSNVIDAMGRLTVPGFIDPHIHLDKTLITDVVRPNVSGTLKEAIEIIWEKKKIYTNQDIMDRAGTIIKMALANGTTRLRTHVDIDTIGGLKPLYGVLEAREKYAHLMDIQIVAFPQEGIIQDPGCIELMEEAIKIGADLVGGMPANEKTPEDSREHIRLAFDLAEKYDRDIDMHVDETDDPFYRTLEILADETIKRGYQGRVTAGHTCALASYDDHYAQYVMEKVLKAEINMITNPVTNLMLQGRGDTYPKRRGLTRVKELVNLGVNVAFGQDCVKDTFYPFGRADLLEVGLIGAHAAHMSLPHEIKAIFNMPFENSAKILRLDDYGIDVGKRADIVVLDAAEENEALRIQATRLYVIRKGKIMSSTVKVTNYHY